MTTHYQSYTRLIQRNQPWKRNCMVTIFHGGRFQNLWGMDVYTARNQFSRHFTDETLTLEEFKNSIRMLGYRRRSYKISYVTVGQLPNQRKFLRKKREFTRFKEFAIAFGVVYVYLEHNIDEPIEIPPPGPPPPGNTDSEAADLGPCTALAIFNPLSPTKSRPCAASCSGSPHKSKGDHGKRRIKHSTRGPFGKKGTSFYRTESAEEHSSGIGDNAPNLNDNQGVKDMHIDCDDHYSTNLETMNKGECEYELRRNVTQDIVIDEDNLLNCQSTVNMNYEEACPKMPDHCVKELGSPGSHKSQRTVNDVQEALKLSVDDHISCDSATAEEIIIGCDVQIFFELVQKLCPTQREWVSNMGFGSLLSISITNLDASFCNWVTKKFNPDTKKLQLRDNISVVVDDIMVSWVLGIPAGDHLYYPLPANKKIAKDLRLDYKDSPYGSITVKKVMKLVLSEKKDATKFGRHFLLFALGVLLCPTQKKGISPLHLNVLHYTNESLHYNWGKYVLDWLVSYRRKIDTTKETSIGGCTLLLVIIYLDRIQHGLPVQWLLKTSRLSQWCQTNVVSAIQSDKLSTSKCEFGAAKVVEEVIYGKPYPNCSQG